MDAPAVAATLEFDEDDIALSALAVIVARAPVEACRGRVADAIDVARTSCLESRIPNVALLGREATQWLRRNGLPDDASPARAEPAARSAEIVYRHLHIIEECAPDVIILHADAVGCHVDHRALLDAHIARARGAMVACVAMPADLARRFGVVGLGPSDRIVRYVDKPLQPQVLPGDSSTSLVSTGVVVFDRELLVDLLTVDASDRWSTHDFGRDLLPLLIGAGGIAAYVVPGRFAPQ